LLFGTVSQTVLCSGKCGDSTLNAHQLLRKFFTWQAVRRLSLRDAPFCARDLGREEMAVRNGQSGAQRPLAIGDLFVYPLAIDLVEDLHR
jgi:hypothetical protein